MFTTRLALPITAVGVALVTFAVVSAPNGDRLRPLGDADLLAARGTDPSSTQKKVITCTQANIDYYNDGLPVGDPLWVYAHNDCQQAGNDCLSCNVSGWGRKLNNDTVKGGYVDSGPITSCDTQPNSSYAGRCVAITGGYACNFGHSFYCDVDVKQYQLQSGPP